MPCQQGRRRRLQHRRASAAARYLREAYGRSAFSSLPLALSQPTSLPQIHADEYGSFLLSRSTKRVGDCKLFANSDCRGILNFTMSRYSAGALCGRIMVDAVVCTFANKLAAMRFQVANQINSLHKSRHGNRYLFPSNFFSTMRFAV